MNNPFDSDRLKQQIRALNLRDAADRDRELSVLRAVWEHMKAESRAELRAELLILDRVAKRVGELTGWLLAAPNLATCSTAAYEVACSEGKDAPPACRAVAKLRREVFVNPAELVCAMDCWSAGEDYLPEGPTHPRWPFPDEREKWLNFSRIWDETTPAKDDDD